MMTDKRKNRNKRQIGAYYEQTAGRYLEQLGYKILEYNYRCRLGEIDIVAKDGEYMVFCEVKYRSDRKRGNPLEAVDFRKQQTIFRCAMFYLTEHGFENIPCRFDVIGIEGEPYNVNNKVSYIKNAFTG